MVGQRKKLTSRFLSKRARDTSVIHVKKTSLSAKEVAELLGIAESTAYAVIRGWNKELKAQGYFTKAGSVPRAYFEKKCYGYGEAQ